MEPDVGRESLILCIGDCMGEKGHFALKIQWMRYVIFVSQIEPNALPPSAFLSFRKLQVAFLWFLALSVLAVFLNGGRVWLWNPGLPHLAGGRCSFLSCKHVECINLKPWISSEKRCRPYGSVFKWKYRALMSLLSAGIRSCWIRLQSKLYNSCHRCIICESLTD